MRPGNILSGAAFRVVALSLSVFCVVMLIAGFAILEIVRASMINDIRSKIVEEVILFDEIYRNEGPSALSDAIDRLARSRMPAQPIVGLFAENGARLAGDVELAPDFYGWGTIAQKVAGAKAAQGYHVEVVSLAGRKVVVGRRLDLVEAMERTLTRALLIAGAVVILVSLTIGYFVSRGALDKLEKMAAVLEDVSRGESGARLKVGAGRDQIDRISVMINAHLDRLSTLMETTRNSIIAVAHDLRTPLNRAFLSVQKASDKRTGADEREAALNAASAEIEGIGETFETILRIARIASSDDTAGFERVSATALVEEIAETYQPVLEEAGRELIFETPPDDPAWISGDRRMLFQMLVNLVENAARYAPEGTQVTLGARRDDRDVLIEIADHGPGIPAERREDAVKPLHQLSGLGEAGGAGLGLALVRAVADRHRAKLRLSDNAPGLRVSIRFRAVAD
ncbi:HAMP domain-containing histidine kinase [Pikeienuella piscinae]|uniref:histidine kinase n=1 Tax=Pikeienuella piscinae TaxID=2748098 RepID=A0A7L5BTC4_9RHOB|nr:HAMP domain-containing sensor histidine kinase [Pikeienuella piscinae]QIE54602.1 HAMP domain-containing histidine kinase [Pikeienuella piscinae]